MVLSRDCRRDQGYPKTVAPMSSVSLVHTKTFSAHVAFNFGHDVRGKRFNVHGELHSMKRNDISKDHVAEVPPPPGRIQTTAKTRQSKSNVGTWPRGIL